MERWALVAVLVFAVCRPGMAACPPVPGNPYCDFPSNTPPRNCAAGMTGVEFWDCRLKCILAYVERATPAPGQGHWRLVRGEFEPEGYDYAWQAHGGVFIYYKVLDANGSPIAGQGVETTNFNRPGMIFYQYTDPAGAYWTTQPMEGQTSTFTNCVCTTVAVWPYTGKVSETGSPAGLIGPSDKVHGMGLTNPPYGTFCNAHVNYRLTFQWTPPTAVIISPSPTSIDRTIVKGQALSTETLGLLNEGGSLMHFTIADDGDWISVSPTTGTLNPAASRLITLTYNTVGLNTGLYRANIIVSDPNAIPPQITVPVELFVKGRYRGDFDGDDDVDQADFGHIQMCITGAAVAQGSSACRDARIDEDYDVDEDDLAVFIPCFSGSGLTPGTNCQN